MRGQVVGDLAHRVQDGHDLPGVAQVAMQGGRHVGKLIAAEARGARALGQGRKPFRYLDKGSMAVIGRSSAVATTMRVNVSGFLAWMMWWAVHIFYLIGFRSRLLVMISWAWSWLSFQRGARLITGEVGALPPVRDLRADGTLAVPQAEATVAIEPEKLAR